MTPSSDPSRGFTLLEQAIIIAVLGIMAVITVPNILKMLDRAKLNHAIAELRSALDETQREALRGNEICTLTLNLAAGEISGSCLPTGSRTISDELDIATNLIQAADIPTQNGPQIAQAHKSRAIQLFEATEHQLEQQRVAPTVQTDMGMNLGLGDDAPQLIALQTARQTATQPAPPKSAGMVVEVIRKQSGAETLRYPMLLAMGGEGGEGDEGGEPENPDPPTPPDPPPPPDLPTPPDPPSSTPEVPIRFGGLGNPEFAIATSASIPTDPSAKIVMFLSDKPGIAKRCVAISNSLGLIRVGRYEGSTDPAEITDSGLCRAEDWQAQ